MVLRYYFIFVVIAVLSASTKADCDALPEGLTSRFIAGKSFDIVGDFNRDGIIDQLQIVAAESNFKKSSSMVIDNPWDGIAGRIDKKGQNVALLITHGGKKGDCKRYLLVDQDYFATTIWVSFLDGDDVGSPIGPVNLGSPKFKKWKREVPQLKGDGIELYTEAGIEILLYWTKGHYEVFWPDEEP